MNSNYSSVFNESVSDGATTSYSLRNLEEDSDFIISIAAINPSGRSEAAVLMVSTSQSGNLSHI